MTLTNKNHERKINDWYSARNTVDLKMFILNMCFMKICQI